jgi:hypothetical protein
MEPIMTFWELQGARVWHAEGPDRRARQNDFSVDRLLVSLDYWMAKADPLLNGGGGDLVGVDGFGADIAATGATLETGFV